jgi:hypothetical protein
MSVCTWVHLSINHIYPLDCENAFARKRFLSSMSSHVHFQFTWLRELLITPCAHKWFFSRVSSYVHLQMYCSKRYIPGMKAERGGI